MAQFDVFTSPRGGIYPLIIDIQANVHSKLATRIVVPLVARSRYATQPLTRLTPIVTVAASSYVAVFPLMAAVPCAALGPAIASLTTQRTMLISALDLLIAGS